MERCLVLGGWGQWLVQGLLLVTSLSVLGLKHLWEQRTGRSDRSTVRFFFDSSKQLAGALWMHGLNLLCAGVLGSETKTDSCQWYWIEIMVDTTIGVYVEFSMMQCIVGLKRWRSSEALRCAVDLIQESCFDDGDTVESTDGGREQGVASADLTSPLKAAADSPSLGGLQDILARVDWHRYLAQLGVWLCVVTIMKLIMLTITAIFGPQFLDLAGFVLSPFESDPNLELLFVMILTPVVMDTVQFVLQDNILTDIDEGRLAELPPVRASPPRRGRHNFLADIKAANEKATLLQEDNDELRLEIEGLRAELKYFRSGFLARIILATFRAAEEDAKGWYRVTKARHAYQMPEFPLRVSSHKLKLGRVKQVEELREGEDPQGKPVRWARFHKPEGLWILLVDGKGQRSARRLEVLA
mmetsp:Transcript_47707/g.147051  ORF Transcript_47707/g.147051 Transcript_47707/m.147051 type:complete len:413 (+) Transcript_47707:46-1284(+)